MPKKVALSPIVPDDLFSLKFFRFARLSPDGRQVVYCVASYEGAETAERCALWLHTFSSGETRQLSTGLFKDTNPVWSPDGQRIAFLSNRDGAPQIYMLPVDGGEAQCLTDIKQGVGGGPIWSPDGKRLAFTCGPEIDPPDPKQPYRLTRQVYRFDGMGYLDPILQDVYVIPVQGGKVKRLTDEHCMNGLMSWSPDSRSILFVSTLKPDTYHIDPFLSVVGLDGKIQTLVKEWGSAETAAWLPDGKSVVFMGTPHGKPIGTKNDLWVLPLTGAHPECRTKKVAPGVGGGLQGDMPQGIIRNPSVFVDEQGKYAFVQVQTGGEIHVNRVALHGPEEVTPLDQGLHAAVPLDVKSGKLLYLVSQSCDPMNLFIKDLESGKAEQFTQLNDEFLSRHLFPTVERMLFKGEDGVPVEGWLMKPVSGQAPYPTVLYIHGGPHSAFGRSFSFDFQMLAGAGFAVLFINQRASKGYDDAFATAIKGDWGHLDYTDLMAGLDLAIEKGLVDPDRLGVCGLSGGGNLSCWIVGHTRRFKAAVPENPVTNWVSFYGVSDIGPWFSVEELGGTPYEIPDVYRRCSPITYANNCTTPTLFVQGEADYRCPAEQSEQFYTVLKANGCVAEMLRLPGSPHAGSMEGEPIIRSAQNEALLGWMKKYVLGKE